VELFLRLFADCESAEVASEIARRLHVALSQLNPEAFSPPKPYWKLPQLFEFTFTLVPPTEAQFQLLISSPPGGWSHSGSEAERSSVWNRAQDQVFLLPEVSWANVELHKTASVARMK
jgi:hypothetical protein